MTPEQIALLVRNCFGPLVLYARAWVAAPEDVVQTAFLKLVKLNKPPDHPVAWLYTVVRNAARDAQRGEKRRAKYETKKAEQVSIWFVPSEDRNGFDAELATKALELLQDDTREIVVAHLWGGLTFEQIAKLVGSSASTVFRRYNSGLQRLRETLGEPCHTTN